MFFYSLQDLILDQNLLSIIPLALWDLKYLKTLRVASNRLALPPDKPPEMRALVLSVRFHFFANLLVFNLLNFRKTILVRQSYVETRA